MYQHAEKESLISGGSHDTNDGYPLQQSHTNSPFRYGPREFKDVAYIVLFVLLLGAMVIGGAYATSHRNRNFENIVNGNLNMSLASSCPSDKFSQNQARYFLFDDSKPEFDAQGAIRIGMIWVLASVVAAIALGCCLVYTFVHKAGFAMKFTIAVQVGLPLLSAFFFLAKGIFAGAVFFFIITALNALCFYLYKNQLALCTKLLEVAATGLKDNHMLVPTVLLLKLMGLAIILPSVGAGVMAFMNGSVVPNDSVTSNTSDGTCLNEVGDVVSCCAWKTDDWVPPFIALVVFGVMWTFNTIFEIRLFTSSSALVQWYYTPVGLHRQGKAISLGLYHAFGPQLGTCCYGGLVLTLVDYLRQLANNAADAGSNNAGIGEQICRFVVAMAIDCIAAIVEYLTKFTTIMASITGDGLCVAARSTYDILTRNFLSSLSVWWIPSTVLSVMCLTISVIWTFVTFVILWAIHSHQMSMVVVISVITFFLTFMALSFVATMLTLAVDVCYVCYAMDLDTQQQNRKDVHDIFDVVKQEQPIYKKQMASMEGPIIQQPGGGLAYGA